MNRKDKIMKEIKLQELEYICKHCGFLSMVARNCPVCKVPLTYTTIPDQWWYIFKKYYR